MSKMAQNSRIKSWSFFFSDVTDSNALANLAARVRSVSKLSVVIFVLGYFDFD
jgi:hypothetical protein